MEFTVDRKTWLRGEGGNGSCLLRDYDGKMCCLGFRALACGLTDAGISGVRQPNHLGVHLTDGKWDGYVTNGENALLTTNICDEIMRFNDEKHFSASSREERLTDLFKSLGDTVTFVD